MRRSPRTTKLRLLALLVPAAFSGAAAFAQLPAGQVFADVAVTDPWYNATYTLYQLGISVGCTPLPAPDFCPTQDLLRQDMAAFIVRAWSARVWNDPEAFKTQTAQNNNAYFSDVPYGSAQFVYIQKLYELGITSGATAPQIDGNGNLIAQGTFVPLNTLHNYEIAAFVARARSLSDNGCAAAYYNGTPKPFPVSSNASCAANNFTAGTTPYFSDVPQSDTYFKYVQRLGDLNVYQSPSTIIAYPGCASCVFGEQNVILRSQMAIWTVSGMGLLPESVLSINAPGYPGGPNGYAVQPAITVAFTFTLYDQTPASIEYGQFLLSNTSGDTIQNTYCSGAWAPAALKLYDATPASATGYNQPLGDGFCTVSLVSVTPITNGIVATVNFTFNPVAAGVTYNVFHEVIYTEDSGPWENVGTLQVLTPQPLNPAPTVTLTDTTQSSGTYFAGDSYTVTVTSPQGTSGLPVTEIINGIDYGIQGFTNASGVSSFFGTWSTANVGSYAETWFVDGVQTTSNLLFTVQPGSPTPVLPSLPNSFTAVAPQLPCADVTGNWYGYDVGGPRGYEVGELDLTQTGSTVSGTFTWSSETNCTVESMKMSGQLQSDGSFTISGTQPNSFDSCGYQVATSITYNFSLSGSSCSNGSGTIITNLAPQGISAGFVSMQAKNTTTPTNHPTAAHYAVSYSGYIPADHVSGPTPCAYTPPFQQLPVGWPMIYKGDAFRGSYRVTQWVVTIPGVAKDYNQFYQTGATRNYGFGSPVNGVNANLDTHPLTSDIYFGLYGGVDEDNKELDCLYWNARDQANKANMMSFPVSYPYPTQAQVHFFGNAANPLEFISPPYLWDMSVVVDESNPGNPTAYVNYNHTCYPAHIVKVNGTVVYSYQQPDNSLDYITKCLFQVSSKIIGVSTPVSVPTQ